MNGEYRLSERIDGGTESPSYLQRWICDPPPVGVSFRVLREEWTGDYEIRTIYEIEISDAVDE